VLRPAGRVQFYLVRPVHIYEARPSAGLSGSAADERRENK